MRRDGGTQDIVNPECVGRSFRLRLALGKGIQGSEDHGQFRDCSIYVGCGEAVEGGNG